MNFPYSVWGKIVDPVPAQCGVYGIVQDNQLMYIGASLNCRRRLQNSVVRKKVDASKCKIIMVPVVKRDRFRIEARLISEFAPPLNAIGGNAKLLPARHEWGAIYSFRNKYKRIAACMGLLLQERTTRSYMEVAE